MNDVLNFKSITTYRVALPLKFEFKTAKGTVRVRESDTFPVSNIALLILDTGNVSLSQTLFIRRKLLIPHGNNWWIPIF